MLNVLIMMVVAVAAATMLYPRVLNARLWRATVTPLASIIGSGYLVIGPILHSSYGLAAPLYMAALCGTAWLFGAAVRHNIRQIGDGVDARARPERRIDMAASWALAFAYVISVAYYLNLFGQFGLSLTTVADQFHARLLTTTVFLLILFVGWTHGFKALQRMEQVTVAINLAIIAGMIFGLGWYFFGKLSAGALVVEAPTLAGWPALTLVFGLLVTVQGFETSRYLGDEYDAATRARSMQIAQAFSTAIYLVYIGFLTFSFTRAEVPLQETAIIGMMGIVAPILSMLLVAAALSAQFSAAVADAGGSGGLIAELTGHRIKPRQAYGILVSAGLILTWSSNVFQIISYASRAFAIYYALQAAIAALSAWRQGRWSRAAGFAGLALVGVAIALFGAPVE